MSTILGLRIRELRMESDLLQKDIAIKLGLSTSGYGYYETGRRSPDNEMIKKLSELFEVSSDYLLGISEDKNNLTRSTNNNFKNTFSTKGLSKVDIEIIQAIIERLKK